MLDNIQQNDRRVQTLEHTMSHFHIEAQQANRVKNLTLSLFKQVREQIDVRKIDGEAMLIGAAMLHELGLHIEYKQYHAHGAYILAYLPLIGYSQQQREGIKTLVFSHRQDINLHLFENFHPDVRGVMLNLSRILRWACLLSIRRKDKLLPDIRLKVDGDRWQLTFPQGWLKAHPLIDAELANEKWQQHKVGWQLNCL
jgi:exopolyphosphatase/guanosine-5'-triphosphate,3'-diphosphate pyrophosphatase